MPILEDRTSEFGIAEELTNTIIDAYTSDNTLKIADRRNADSILNGVLLKIEERAGVYTAEDVVEEIRVFVTVQIKYEDIKNRKIIWEGTINQFGSYAPDSDSSTREQAITEAIDKIAKDIITKTVSGW